MRLPDSPIEVPCILGFYGEEHSLLQRNRAVRCQYSYVTSGGQEVGKPMEQRSLTYASAAERNDAVGRAMYSNSSVKSCCCEQNGGSDP
jgi:hypothetical protein